MAVAVKFPLFRIQKTNRPQFGKEGGGIRFSGVGAVKPAYFRIAGRRDGFVFGIKPFGHFFAFAQTGDDNRNVFVRLKAVAGNQLFRQFPDQNRFSHIENVGFPAFADSPRAQNQTDGFGNCHEIAADVGVGQGQRTAFFNLGFKKRNNAAA